MYGNSSMYAGDLGLNAGAGFLGLGSAGLNSGMAPGLNMADADLISGISPGLNSLGMSGGGYPLMRNGGLGGGLGAGPVPGLGGLGLQDDFVGGSGFDQGPGMGAGGYFGGAGGAVGGYAPRGRRDGPGGRSNFSRPQHNSGGPDGGEGKGRMDETFIPGKLFIGGLSTKTTTEAFKRYCSQWGPMSDCVVMSARGFGFVTFVNPLDAQAFLDHREHFVDGRRAEAKAAVPKNTGGWQNLTKKMFVGGTGALTDDDLYNYFAQFGVITDAAIVRIPATRASRGFGFVTFDDEISVEKCLVMTHSINGHHVELKRAVPKEENPGPRGGPGRGRDAAGGLPSGASGPPSGNAGGGYGRGARGGAGGPQRFRPY